MTGAARSLCAVVVCTALIGSLGVKSEKRSYRHGPSNGRRLPLPAVSPFRMDSVTPSPSTLDPYACLPRYLCVVENKNGEKRTTIVHGLHPALRKAKPNVIDPSTLPKVPGGGSKPLFPPPFMTEDDDIYRDREFNDSFLQQQEMAEALAFLEEKRRQYMYQQGKKRPTSKVIPKGSKPPVADSLEEKSDEESKEEEEEKSQEASKEEKDISSEASKEEEEKEEKDEPEPVDESEENASSEKQSRSRLSKYQLKKKMHSMKFKARNDESDEDVHADMTEDRLATVPWDDRGRNDTDPLKPSEIYDKLFGKVLPTFQLPSVSKIAKNLPGASFFTSSSDEKTTTTTTTPKPGLLKRMIKAVTGGNSAPTRSERHHYRYKRDVNDKLIAEEAKIVRQIRDPDRQCRMIFKGCDLPYDHIMKMVSSGKVLIENDAEVRTTTRRTSHLSYSQDDEADQAVKDKLNPKKSPKPIPQLLAQQATLGGNKKVVSLPIFGNNKNKPSAYDGSSEESLSFYRPKMKKKIASLPLMPMKYQWGTPTASKNGKPDFSGGINDPNAFKPLPTTTVPTTTTTPRPLFPSSTLDKKSNLTVPSFQQSIIRLNKTHSVHVVQKKAYNPGKTRTRDAKGQPVSFSSVFTEIAGNTGGIHDFFDRISGAFAGEQVKASGRELTDTFPGSNPDHPERYPQAQPTAFPPAPEFPLGEEVESPPTSSEVDKNDDDGSDEEDEDEDNDDEGSHENNDEEQNEEPNEETNDDDEDSDEEDEEEEDIADDLVQANAYPAENQNQKPNVPQHPSPSSIESQLSPFVGVVGEKQRPANNNHNKNPAGPNEENNDDDDEGSDEEDEEEEDDVADDLAEANPAENQKQKPKVPKHPSPSSVDSQLSPFYGVVGEKKRPENNKKNKNPAGAEGKEQEGEEEEDEEEIEDDDEAAIANLPDTIPEFIKHSMIEDFKKKQKEQEEGGGQQGGQQGGPQQGGGRPGPGGRPQPYGRPGQGPPPHQQQGQPPKKGGFFSSFFS